MCDTLRTDVTYNDTDDDINYRFEGRDNTHITYTVLVYIQREIEWHLVPPGTAYTQTTNALHDSYQTLLCLYTGRTV